ncbi:MAG: DUF2182 domain-containing protein [Bacteroidetes bacterium]|nr:DUF2182 domain-containing protein [Bacteroidota bacterium]
MSEFFRKHPEWWVWLVSLLVWVLLLRGILFASHEERVIFCTPAGGIPAGVTPAADEGPGVFKGLMDWILMVIAMMFPLLGKPVRHVAFSVKKKDRWMGILSFLAGYIVVWAAVGVLVLFLRMSYPLHWVTASLFLLAAAVVWLPGRPIQMMQCGITMPIRIEARQLRSDALSYGFKMGAVCLKLCWAPMLALALIQHNIIVMYMVTSVLIFERYWFPHTSKFSGYAWGIIALVLFGVEIG